MLSGYLIDGKVWLVRTERVAEQDTPTTLPIGSLVLTPPQAKRLGHQLLGTYAKWVHSEGADHA